MAIETLKEASLIMVNLSEEIFRTFEDGKFRIFETFNFLDDFKDVATFIKQGKIELAKKELEELDKEGRNELVAFVEKELKMPKDHVEPVVLSSLSLLLAINNMIEAEKLLKKQNKEGMQAMSHFASS